MAYTAPRTWATGTLAASAFTIDIHDNLTSLRGLNDVSCRVYLNNDLSLTSGVDTAISWEASAWNYGSMWNSGLNPNRITVPTTGIYSLDAILAFHSDSSGDRRLSYRINGTTTHRLTVRNGNDNSMTYVYGGDRISLSANDYVEILAFQNSGGALNLDSGPDRSTLTLTLLGDANGSTWTIPKTWALGENITLSDLNTYVRDDVKTLRGLNSAACRLTMSANLSVANNNGVRPAWNTEQWDYGSIHSTAVSASEINIGLTGWYEIWGRAVWALNTSGRRGLRWVLNRNGSDLDTYVCDVNQAVAATGNSLCFVDEAYLTSGDRILMDVIQQAGAAINLIGGTTGSAFGVRLIGTTAT